MPYRLISTILLTATFAFLPFSVASAHARAHPVVPWSTRVTHKLFAEWSKVAQCEEGGNWKYDLGSYAGALGIQRSNWIPYALRFHLPLDAAHASPVEQVFVAMQINKGYQIPDQNGVCRAW